MTNWENTVWIDDITTTTMVYDESESFSAGGSLSASIQQEIYGLLSAGSTFSPGIINPGIVSSISPYLITGKVNVNLSDKMIQGNFNIDKAVLGGYGSTAYFKKIEFKIPDYTATLQTVFVGVIPSSVETYAPGADKETMTAYDYALFLTAQYLDPSDQVLLPIDDQGAETLYRLNYDYNTDPLLNFEYGQWVTGGTTGDTGQVLENHFSGYMGRGYLILRFVSGTPVAGHYFQDDEDLDVDSVKYAAADGYTMDVTGTELIYPDDWLKRVLGGADWETVTGIYPYLISSSGSVWGDTKPEIPFVFEDGMTKIQAIEKVSKYLGFLSLIKWRTVGGVTQPCYYWGPESWLDPTDPSYGSNYFAIPATVTITAPNAYLISPVRLTLKGEERYNKITVKCRSLDGVWYRKTIQTSALTAKEELPYEMPPETNPDLATQAECNARCQDLYDYYTNSVSTWDATFNLRSDFQLLQLITFSGYGTEIPDGTYRIIGIEYNYGADGTEIINQVTCTLVLQSQFKAYLNLSRTFTDTIKMVQAIVKDELRSMGSAEVATVMIVDGKRITVATESGLTKIVSDGSE